MWIMLVTFLHYAVVGHFRYHGANTPSVGLTLYRLGDDNALDRFGIKDGIWRKVTSCRRWSTSGPRLPA